MSKTTSKKTAAKKQSSAAELTKRLGPVVPVVRMARAAQTKAAYRLTLKCGHVRVATKRSTLRCRKCRKGGK